VCVCLCVCVCVCVIVRAPTPAGTRATQTGRVYQEHGARPVEQSPERTQTQSGPVTVFSVRP